MPPLPLPTTSTASATTITIKLPRGHSPIKAQKVFERFNFE
jgi:hypothetical protein